MLIIGLQIYFTTAIWQKDNPFIFNKNRALWPGYAEEQEQVNP
jgi:hypothetical protein